MQLTADPYLVGLCSTGRKGPKRNLDNIVETTKCPDCVVLIRIIINTL